MKQCDNGHFYDENRYSGCPYCSVPGAAGKTVYAGERNHTLPLKRPEVIESDRSKTVGLIKKSIGIDPPVGFVICVSGPHKGEEFRLVSGRNFIGRSSRMDVALTDDPTVSREEHAVISYDVKSNTFLLSPGTGRGITYLNNKQTEAAQSLGAYDVIEVGSCRLLFLPLCSERFKWMN
jgi:hypothetical protein